MTSIAHTAPPAAALQADASPASERLHAALAALPESELLAVNLDIDPLTARIRLRLPELVAVERDLHQRGRQPNAGSAERIELCCEALAAAHHRCVQLQQSLPSPSTLAAELARVRHRLLQAAQSLVVAGAFPASAVEPYRLFRDHRSLARSVCGLAGSFLTHWEKARDRTPLNLPELQTAVELARQLSLVAHGKPRSSAELARALRERQQWFTLLLQEYAALRRAAQALYGKDEAARRVPSLYGKRPSGLRHSLA